MLPDTPKNSPLLLFSQEASVEEEASFSVNDRGNVEEALVVLFSVPKTLLLSFPVSPSLKIEGRVVVVVALLLFRL